jgi:galactoside O-acetyltransferase
MAIITKIKNLFSEFFLWFLQGIPSAIGTKLRYIIYKRLFKKSGKFTIQTGVTIKGFRNIELGDNVQITKNCYLIAPDGGSIKIGNNCTFNSNVMINATPGRIVLGDCVAIGPNSVLRASDHNFGRIDVPIRDQCQVYGEIILEGDNWVSANCVLTANVKIGKGTIIGAGAVVTKNIEGYSIAGGVPARILKKRVQTSDPDSVKLKDRSRN